MVFARIGWLPVLCVCFAAPQKGAAAPAGVTRETNDDFSVVEGCPDRRSFDDKLAMRAGSEFRRTHSVRVVVTKEGSGHRGSVEVTTGGKSRLRTLSSESCTEVLDALALSAALAIEDLEAEQAAPEQVHDSTPTPKPNDPPQSSLRFGAGASADLRGYVVPVAALGPGLLLAAEMPGTGFAPLALLRGFLHHGTATGQTGSAQVRALGAALDVCPYRIGQRWSATACVSTEVASLKAEARGVSFPKNPSRTFVGAGAALRGRYVLLPALALATEVGLVASLSRPSFSFDTGEQVFRVPGLGARAGVALVFFPLP